MNEATARELATLELTQAQADLVYSVLVDRRSPVAPGETLCTFDDAMRTYGRHEWWTHEKETGPCPWCGAAI